MEYTYTPGQQVAFTAPASEEETTERMTVIEDRGNRVLVISNTQAKSGRWTVLPQYVYSKTDIMPA